MKTIMDEFITRYPDFEELVVGEFTLRQCEHALDDRCLP